MIETARLVLRRARPGDLNDLHAIFTDARVMRYWDRPPHTDIEQTRAFLDALMQADSKLSDDYIIELDSKCIGKAGIWQKPEVGYILHHDTWGHGYATEALRAILPRAFAKWPDLEALTAEIDPRNIASAHVLARLGFVQTGYAECNFLYGDTEWCDTAYYALPRPR